MSLPERYGKRIRRILGAVAVWQPGTPIALGTVMGREDGRYRPIDDIGSFTDLMKSTPHQDQNLNLVSQGVRQRLFQANAELPSTAALDLTAEASVKYEFSSESQYVLKTPTLRGSHISNLNRIAAALKGHADWDHKKFYLVHEVYDADSFSFVGNETRKSGIEISGNGSAILGFLTAGVSAGLKKTGSAEVEILGKGGSLAMGLVRIKRDGTTDFVP